QIHADPSRAARALADIAGVDHFGSVDLIPTTEKWRYVPLVDAFGVQEHETSAQGYDCGIRMSASIHVAARMHFVSITEHGLKPSPAFLVSRIRHQIENVCPKAEHVRRVEGRFVIL